MRARMPRNESSISRSDVFLKMGRQAQHSAAYLRVNIEALQEVDMIGVLRRTVVDHRRQTSVKTRRLHDTFIEWIIQTLETQYP